MTPVCFLDLDGVLADFVTAALRLHGKVLPTVDVRWDFCTQIGFAGIHDPAFWAPMGFDFWAGIGWTPEGRAVLDAAESAFRAANVCLMTSPCDTAGAVEGKVEWVRRNLPDYKRRFFVGPPKHLAAGPGKLLVDDYDGNCDAFAKHGGLTVMPPRPWNRRRDVTDAAGGFDAAIVAAEIRLARDALCSA